MSPSNGKPLDPAEVACLPAGDPHRDALLRQLEGAPPKERQRWEEELALSDRLREELGRVDVPANLQARLLAVPAAEMQLVGEKAVVSKPTRRVFGMPPRAAAGLVIVAGLAAAYLFTRKPAAPERLDAAVAKSLAALAVQHHATPPAVVSADPEKVKQSLEASGLDVPVIMLAPEPGTTLEGGGTCNFGGVKAAFTRWKNGDSTYTLYEFNGRKLGAPGIFYSVTQQPRELWNDQFQYQVFVFPGSQGKCCWALVMETERAKNVFAQYGAQY